MNAIREPVRFERSVTWCRPVAAVALTVPFPAVMWTSSVMVRPWRVIRETFARIGFTCAIGGVGAVGRVTVMAAVAVLDVPWLLLAW